MPENHTGLRRTPYLCAPHNVFIGWPIDHNGADPLWRSPKDPDIGWQSTTVVSLCVPSDNGNNIWFEAFVAQVYSVSEWVFLLAKMFTFPWYDHFEPVSPTWRFLLVHSCNVVCLPYTSSLRVYVVPNRDPIRCIFRAVILGTWYNIFFLSVTKPFILTDINSFQHP